MNFAQSHTFLYSLRRSSPKQAVNAHKSILAIVVEQRPRPMRMLRALRSPARQYNVIKVLGTYRSVTDSCCRAEAAQQMSVVSDLGQDKTAIRKQLKKALRQTPVQQLEQESRPEHWRLLPCNGSDPASKGNALEPAAQATRLLLGL